MVDENVKCRHACITAATLRDDDNTRLKERHKESYLTVCKQYRLTSGKGFTIWEVLAITTLWTSRET